MNVPDDQRLESERQHVEVGADTAQVAGSEPGPSDPGPAGLTGAYPAPPSLQALLAGYDREVEDALHEAIGSTTGTGTVRVLHNTVRRSVSVHDAVVGSVLCPLLEDLPGGPAVAQRLRQGCQERADLLGRFEKISHNVAAINVYPVSGEEIEGILEGLERSFAEHVTIETTDVGTLLEAAAGSIDPDVVGARMAIEARQAPTRAHGEATRRSSSPVLQAIHRNQDRFRDWSDSHWGWSDPRTARPSPRARQVDLLKSQPTGSTPSIRDVLTGYDATVDDLIIEFRSARTGVDRVKAAYRLQAAVTVHDSVLGGVLCPLLEAVPGGEPLAVRLHDGCRHRAKLQQAWGALAEGVEADDPARLTSSDAEELMESMIESFHSHEEEESLDVSSLLEQLPDSAYRTNVSPMNDVMWPWYSEGPGLLALRMAMWAQAGPTHVHPALVRHPTSRALRNYFHVVDGFRDHWADSAIGRWLSPELPPQPFSGQVHRQGREGAGPAVPAPSAGAAAERQVEAV